MAIATVDPTTGETLETFEPLTEAEVEDRLARAAAAFRSYRRTSFAQRAEWMRAAVTQGGPDASSVGSPRQERPHRAGAARSIGSAMPQPPWAGASLDLNQPYQATYGQADATFG